MRSLAVLVAVGLVVVAALAQAAPPPPLRDARVCDPGNETAIGECVRHYQRLDRVANGLRCSVRVDAPRPLPFTARLLYDGQVQRSESTVLRGSHVRTLAMAFRTLTWDDRGLPRGRYTCEFRLGNRRLAATATGSGSTRAVRGAASCLVYAAMSRVCNPQQQDFLASPRSISCSALLVKQAGRLATTELQRLDGTTWTTLYSGSDRVSRPLAEVWAYTTASPERFFVSGTYRCLFSVDGAVVGARTFKVLT